MKFHNGVKMVCILGAGSILMSARGQAQNAQPTIDPEIVKTILSAESTPPQTPVNTQTATPAEPLAPLQKLEDVLRYSYVHNKSLQSVRAGMKAVQERLPQALSGWKPTVSATAGINAADIDGAGPLSDGGISKDIEARFSQPLYRGGRTVAATGSAMNVILAQRSLLRDQEQNVLLATATSYMDVSRDTALLSLAENNQDVIGRQTKATQQRFDVGDLTRTDVSQAQARFAGAEANRIGAQGNLQKSRAVFEQVTGQPVGLTGDPQLKFPIPETLDQAVDQAEKYNPRIVAARFLHRAAQKDIDLVFGEMLPQLGLSGSIGRSYDPQPGLLDETTTKSIGVNATVPIYTAGLTQSRVREAKYTANQRYLEILGAASNVREEVVRNWENLRAAQAEITSRIAQVEATRLAQEGVHQEAEVGARTILDALDAEQEYLDAQAALITARRNEIVATFALASTLGMLSPETLGFPELKEDFDAQFDADTWKFLGTDVDIREPGAQ
ncbi:MAG TPA: TolC family outer membrane protein [Alphaproteobacteria bacterium]|jgi:TolC family type I secretion outer membrane protein